MTYYKYVCNKVKVLLLQRPKLADGRNTIPQDTKPREGIRSLSFSRFPGRFSGPLWE